MDAKVAISGGIFKTVTESPFMSPTNKPTSRAKTIDTPTGKPCLIVNPTDKTDERANIAPTDKSIPATRITNVWPMAITATTVDAQLGELGQALRLAANQYSEIELANQRLFLG